MPADALAPKVASASAQNIQALAVNTMPADALAPKVASASAGMVLAL